jgi:hypothetical protein
VCEAPTAARFRQARSFAVTCPRVERTYAPRPAVSVAMRFDAIIFDAIILDGAPVGLNLIPVGKQDVRGRAVFNFRQEKVILDDKFVSQWRVRSLRQSRHS